MGPVAEPSIAPANDRAEQSATTVSESLRPEAAPEQPLVTQENVNEKPAVGKPKLRPSGQSRTFDEGKPSKSVDKPLVEVRDF